MTPIQPSLEARVAMSMVDSDGRREYAKKYGVMDEVMHFWNGGKICGQCQHFSQLGGRPSGCSGTCKMFQKNEYTKVTDKACSKFERASV